jgi:peptide/nickel transport system substrate-binding protein
MRNRFKWLLVLLLCIFLLPLEGCGQPAAPAAPAKPEAPKKKVLTMAYNVEPDTLNAYATHVLSCKELGVSEGFATTDDKMNYVPMMVESIPTPENGGVKMENGKMVVTWKIRKDLKWNDGKPVTSADALFTYQCMMDTKFMVDSRDGWDTIEKVETPDGLTVKVTFKQTYASYNILFRYILPKHVLEGKDLNTYDAYNRNPVTTAPFMVKEWKAGQYLDLVKNPYYRKPGYPKLDEIIVKFVPDANARINMLKTGEAQHATTIAFDRVEELSKTTGIKVNITPANSWFHFDFNHQKSMFQDLRVRQAIAYAIDRQSIVDKLLLGKTTAAYTPVSPLSWAYNPNAGTQYKYNPDKAKQLLDQAGWKVGADGIRVKNGVKLSFDNSDRTGDADADRVQQVIQANLKAIGIDMKIANVSSTAFGDQRIQGKYDTKFHRWIVPAEPSLVKFYSQNSWPPRGLNDVFYKNAKLTDVLETADVTLDKAKRKDLLFQAQDIIGQEVVTIPVHYTILTTASSTKLTGYKGNPTNDSDGWNMEEWDLNP